MSFAQYIADLRWALNMRRARAWRRGLLFSQRRKFDDALRPRYPERETVVGYPDALYIADVDDLCRAMVASKLPDEIAARRPGWGTMKGKP